MSSQADEVLRCPGCTAAQAITVHRSVNVARTPEVKQELLQCRFMRFTCRRCGADIVVERELLWTDLAAELMVLCFPPGERGDVDACEDLAAEVFRTTAVENCPPVVAELGRGLSLRVVFGYDELREKVLCRDQGLDDRIVEFLKLALLDANPEWNVPGFQGLILTEVRGDTLVFHHEQDGDTTWTEVERAMYDKIEAEPHLFQEWVPLVWEGPWVNARRAA